MKNLILAFIAFIFVSLLSVEAFALPGGMSSSLKDPSSLYGLCTQDGGNTVGLKQVWMTQGYCDAVRERIEKPISCNGVEDAADKVRKGKVAQEIKSMCPEVDMNSEREFTMVFQQIVAALTIEESMWKDNDTSWMGAKGLMQLSRGSVRGYAKCDAGCAQMANTGKMGGDVQSNMANMTCGTAIAMVWVAKDQVLGGGSGNKKSRGIARYFQPYREVDKHKRERMKNKVANYCKTQLKKDSNGGGAPVNGGSRGLASNGGLTTL
jgi:hypothetical protein